MEGQGYLSTNSSINKFSEWTKIILIYCDGSLHQGYRKEPIKYKNTNLYFRGEKIIQAQLKYIEDHYSLSKADRIVLTGGSAGAIGAYLWGNTVRTLAKDPSKVFIIPDSGIILDYPEHLTKSHNFLNPLKNLYKIANLDSEGTPLTVCNAFF